MAARGGGARRIGIAWVAAAGAIAALSYAAKTFHVPSLVRAWLVEELVPKEPVDWPDAREAELGEPPLLPESSRGARSRLTHAIARADAADAALAADVAVRSVDLDGERREAAVTSVPGEFGVSFYVPADGQLSFSVAQHGAPLAAAGVRFQLSVHLPGAEEVPLFDRIVAPYDRSWRQHRIDLSRFSGKRVELRFRTSTADGEPALEDAVAGAPLRAFWGDLFVYAPTPRGAGAAPSILLVLVDTLRPDHLGAYGYALPTSPYVDRLAREGARFDNAISAAPWTDPSILALHTGRYPSDMWESEPHRETLHKKVPSSVETLAERLAQAGYFTIAASDHPGITAKRFGRGFDVYHALYYREGAKYRWQQTPPARVAEQVAGLLAGRADQPLFVYLHVIYPHQPVRPGPRYRALFGADTRDVDLSQRADLDEYVRRYDAEIRVTDDVIGSVLRSFADGRADEDTVVVVVSDHGEGFYEHGLYEHGNSLYDELTRVPLILRAPGRVAPGTVETAVVRTVDVYPTLTELAGIEPPEGIRGRSLVGLLTGGDAGERLAFSESPHEREIVRARAMRSAERKLLLDARPGVEREWFDLTRDPGETTARTDGDDAVERLQRAIDALDDARPAREAAPQHVEPGEETIENLRALGYVE